MGPMNIRRAQRHEMFVPKGTVTVSDVYSKMKQFELHTLLRLRADGALTRVRPLAAAAMLEKSSSNPDFNVIR